jgi:anti-anti-sigma factor
MSRLQDLADLLRNFQSTDAASACVYLEEVTFMGSTCLAFLVSLRNECLERGGSVTLVAPTAVARHLLHLVGFDDAFEILEP